MPFNLFHRKKQPEQKTPAAPTEETQLQPEAPVAEQPQESTPEPAPAPTPDERVEEMVKVIQPKEEETAPAPTETPLPQPAVAEEKAEEPPASVQEQPQAPQEPIVEPKPAVIEAVTKTYLKAMPLKELSDIDNVKSEIKNGNIIILRITPLASKSIEDVKSAVNELYVFAESIGGDIARLGEERVVICPKNIRIWREKTPAPVPSAKPLPTAA